jgi:succinoglycan biosynthesis protein ExoO
MAHTITSALASGGSGSVSVVVAMYNARKSVKRAIDSALAQSSPPVEILVIDDHSRDGSAAFVAETYRDVPQVRVLGLEENGGPARARNIGIGLARGCWIAPLDADDAWLPARLQCMLADAQDDDVVFDNLRGFNSNTGALLRPLFSAFPANGQLTLSALLAPHMPDRGYNFGYLKPLLRREFLLAHGVAYDESLRTSEDLLLYLTLLLEGARSRMINEALYCYSLPVNGDGSASTSSHTQPRDREVAQAIEAKLARYRCMLDEQEVGVIEARIGYLHRIAPVSEFHYARRNRRFGRIGYLLARHPSVRREALRGLWKRVAS